MKLDRNRPFGVVYGECGHCYEQDGLQFDAQGDRVGVESADPVAKPVKGSGRGRARAEAEPDDDAQSQLFAADPDAADGGAPPLAETTGVDP